MERIEIRLDDFDKFDEGQMTLLSSYADLLPSLFAVSLTLEQKQNLEVRHLEIVEKCIDAGLVKTVVDIRDKFVKELKNAQNAVYDG